MQKHLSFLLFQILLKTVLVCVGMLFSGLPAIASKSPARVFDVEGRVFMRPNMRSPKREISVGAPLAPTDLIRPDPRARVLIQCANGRPKPVTVAEWSSVNTICPGIFIEDIRDGSLFVEAGNLQGGSNAQIPYVIAPRNRFLLSPTPTLSWNSVDNTDRYIVSLMADQVQIWQVETAETTIPYPADKPALNPGVWYTLVVKTDNDRASIDEHVSGLRFRVLFPEEAHAIQQIAQEIIDSDVSAQSMKIALAVLYSNNELIAEAITTLESLVNQGNQQPFVYRILGDLYQRSGLRLLSETRYQQAICLATNLIHIEQRAAAQLGLGLLHKRIENLAQSSYWFNLAKVSYRELGEEKVVDLIDRELGQLQSQL
ncbi:MAG: hypothetical protein F6K19_11070 [Cyanothece sp. SIO1E1]|nr:hypothetical protein [Cyanothece sp. SIO1E1]